MTTIKLKRKREVSWFVSTYMGEIEFKNYKEALEKYRKYKFKYGIAELKKQTITKTTETELTTRFKYGG